MQSTQTSGPLEGITVLDFSRVRAGPTCARVLADFGANVIRIEPPSDVDPNASMFADNRLGGDFQNLNRNKRSLTLNLKAPEAIEVVKVLVKKADVVIENWRPAVKERLGLDYEALRSINPRIILASISGYGQDGPYVDRPAFDQIIQGMGGLMSVTGLPGQGPVRAGLAVSDSSSGLYAAIGILLAIIERQKSNEGQWVQASLLHSMIAMMDFQVARYLNDGQVPQQEGNNHPTSSPMGLFAASDGNLNIGVSGDGMWKQFCRAMGEEGWEKSADYATVEKRRTNREKLNELVSSKLRDQPVSHWVDLLLKAGIPAGPVYTIPQVFEDPQVKHLKVSASVPLTEERDGHYITQPVLLSRTPSHVSIRAPGIGEHSAEVLAEFGFSQAKIADLKKSHIV